MAVPSTFKPTHIAKTLKLLLSRLSKCSMNDGGKILGNPFVTYQEAAVNLGMKIENRFDGVHMGGLAAAVGGQQLDLGNPFIACLIVHSKRDPCPLVPGSGFYVYASERGIFQKRPPFDLNGTEEIAFWMNEVNKCARKWGKTK